ncbi:MAG: nucleotidyltransferase family protein [Alphaproteobacteria bacterium]|nr:nucleotidyltransferase family protein [Alphaproteobacteria bacterium]
MDVKDATRLERLLRDDASFMRALAALASLELPDAWIAAGAIRNLVWDRLHGFPHDPRAQDTDVVYFDAARGSADEARLEAQLAALCPHRRWSVRNQARMHLRNEDLPYADAHHAMCRWVETATAIAVRLDDAGALEVAAPFGLGDIFGLIVRPTPHMAFKPGVFGERAREKAWTQRWPRLVVAASV